MLMNFHGATSLGFGKRSQQIDNQDIPGPGTYQMNKLSKINSPKWTIRQKRQADSCFNNKQNSPAPGQYDHQQYIKLRKSFKKRKQYMIGGDKPKGIQLYYSGSDINLPTSINMKTGHQFGYKFQQKINQLSPGPAYNVDEYRDTMKNLKKKTSNGFGFGKRDAIYKQLNSTTPGPGTYNNKSMSTQHSRSSIVFPKGDRKFLQQKQDTDLGPGSYNPKLTEFNRGCKIKGKFKQHDPVIQNIGPGSYQIPESKSPTSVKFVERNSKSLKKEQLQYPSPFDYNPKRFPQAYRSNEGYRMGYAQRNKLENTSITPGPGEYNIPSNLNQNGITISNKLKPRQQAQGKFEKQLEPEQTNPKYDLVNYKSPAFSFPTEIQSYQKPIKSFQLVGPGSYQQKFIKSNEKFTIGKAKRFKEALIQEAPYFTSKIESTIGYIPPYLLHQQR